MGFAEPVSHRTLPGLQAAACAPHASAQTCLSPRPAQPLLKSRLISLSELSLMPWWTPSLAVWGSLLQSLSAEQLQDMFRDSPQT